MKGVVSPFSLLHFFVLSFWGGSDALVENSRREEALSRRPFYSSTDVAGVHVSNSTHVAWRWWDGGYEIQTREVAQRDCLRYLRKHLMQYDSPNLGSLGFPPDDEEGTSPAKTSSDTQMLQTKGSRSLVTPVEQWGDHRDQEHAGSDIQNGNELSLPDGLSDGLVGPTISLSLDSKVYPWTRHVPKSIFHEYVLNFANVNEGRSNWRPFMHKAFQRHIKKLLEENAEPNVEDVVTVINAHLYTACSLTGKKIEFKAGHTPLIYDPMSTIVFGYASCTGLSILLVCALRAVGVPARLAGTAAWYGNVEEGNHSWVEVYTETGWRLNSEDGLGNPCKNWFCTKDRFADGKTQVFAARLERKEDGSMHFPMAWDLQNYGVPGENRTEWMEDICTKCHY